MTVKMMIANNKGGVGKSILAVQLAGSLARRGMNVLVVDMDPQSNATRRLGVTWSQDDPIPSVSEAIHANVEGAGAGAVSPCGWVDESGQATAEAARIDVIPARPDLINRATESGAVGAVRRLKKALSGEWIDAYDAVIIDTQPDLGHLVQMAMSASDYVIITTDAMYDGVEAAIRVSDFVTTYAEDLANPNLKVGGVVVTRWRATKEEQFQLEGLRGRFGDLVWELQVPWKVRGREEEVMLSWIPEWVRFAEADAGAVSLTAWNDRSGRATVAMYDQIADRVIEQLLTVGASA